MSARADRSRRGAGVPVKLRLRLLFGIAAIAAANPAASGAVTVSGYGMRGGVALSRLHGEHSSLVEVRRRTGPAAAWYVRLGAGAFSLQPEVTWASKGQKYDGDVTLQFGPDPVADVIVFDLDFAVRIDYIAMPLLARWDAPPRWGTRPFLVAGPSVAFRTDSRLETTEPAPVLFARPGLRFANIFENVGTFDDPPYRSFDVGLIGGGGFSVGSERLRAALDLRYEYGALSVLPGADRHTGAWVISAGIEVR
jgi:hypothetical protein